MTASPAAQPPKKKYGVRDTVMALGQPRVALMFALGFSSGLPFLLTGATFGYWLRDAGTSLTAIGFLSWVGLAYTFKFLWAPAIDRIPAPFLGKLGQRRGWAMFTQLTIAAALVGMAIFGPHGPGGLATIGALALLVAVGSASQDTAVDAWRIETAKDADDLGLLTSAFTLGFRVALLITDAIILILAQHLSWPLAYVMMAALMGVGLFAAWRTPEPARVAAAPAAQAATVASDAGRQIPRRRLRLSAALFLFAALLAYWGCCAPASSLDGRILGAPYHFVVYDIAKPSLFGLVLSGVLLACAALSFAAVARASWHLGAAAFAIVIAVAFYGAAAGVDLFGGADVFWPMAACLIATALAAPPNVYDAVAGPLIEFFRTHGSIAAIMLLMISLYRLPEFVIGPVAGPFYHDLGLSKDTVGVVRGSIGLIASFAGIAIGGLCVLRLGYLRSLIMGALMQGIGVAAYAVVASNQLNLTLFASAMATDNFCYAFAGVALVTYMSSLTSIGFTATQYALMSSMFTAVGKLLKGYSGLVVDGLHQGGHTLMQSYAIFYIGAGAICLPALALCIYLAMERAKAAPAPA